MIEQGYAEPVSKNANASVLSIKDILRQAQEELADTSQTVQLDTELLLAFVLGKERVYLWTWPEKTVTPCEKLQFESLLESRKNGTPVAYLLGEREFWGLSLKVTRDTLIPRPETELVVDLLLSQVCESRSYRIADLGTGSGAIAIALAHELRNSELVATDKSWGALKVAKENANKHKLTNIEFRQGSWCEPLEVSSFDFIVSNPPYIDKSDPHLKEGDVRYEPRSALVAAQNGLADIEMIIRQTPHHLKGGGLIAFEHGYDQGEAVRDLLKQFGFSKIHTIQDMADLDRVTFGYLL